MVNRRVITGESGVGTALVRLPSKASLPPGAGTVAWGTRLQFGDAGPTTYRALVESTLEPHYAQPGGMVGELRRVRSVRLVPIRPDRDDPDLYPQQPKPRKTGMSRQARKQAAQRARNWRHRR